MPEQVTFLKGGSGYGCQCQHTDNHIYKLIVIASRVYRGEIREREVCILISMSTYIHPNTYYDTLCTYIPVICMSTYIHPNMYYDTLCTYIPVYCISVHRILYLARQENGCKLPS